MIHLVLDRPGKQPTCAELEGLPTLVEGRDLDLRWAHDLSVDLRETEAALGALLWLTDRTDHRIDEDQRHEGIDVGGVTLEPQLAGAILDSAKVEHRELDGMADLLCGQSDSLGRIHRVEHVGYQTSEGVIDLCDRSAPLAEHRIPILHHGQNHVGKGGVALGIWPAGNWRTGSSTIRLGRSRGGIGDGHGEEKSKNFQKTIAPGAILNRLCAPFRPQKVSRKRSGR